MGEGLTIPKHQSSTRFFWIVCLLLSAFLLIGRFDWANESFAYSIRSYFASLFFLVIFLFVLHGWLRFFNLPETGVRITLGTVSLLFSLPYSWLGLRRFLIPAHTFVDSWKGHAPRVPDWFPDAFQSLPAIPGETWIFVGLFVLGIAARVWTKEKRWLLLWAVLLVETWLHLSLRSPYTYVPHYEQPSENQYWYHYNLFPNEKGAVNLDYHLFRPTEELFMGEAHPVQILSARPFPTYVVSQFSGFINPYYVWLFLNIFSWAMASFACYSLGRHFFTKETGWVAAWLMVLAQGPILYVAQPKPYLCAIAFTSCLLYFYVLCVKKKDRASADLFGATFGLWLLCYENHPWILAFLLLSFIDTKSWRWGGRACAVALLIYSGFQLLVNVLPHLSSQVALAPIGGHPLENILDDLKELRLLKIAVSFLKSIRLFGRMLLHACNFILIPAVFGIYYVWKNPASKTLGVLLLPAFLIVTFMELGHSPIYTQLPRISYSAHPVIFLLAAFGLSYWKKAWRYTFLASYFIYVNADVFGHPWIYYLWFYKNAGYSLGAN